MTVRITRQEHRGAHRLAAEGSASRVLFCGEDNPQSVDPQYALYCYPTGCAGHRLQDLILDLSMSAYLATWRTNLCSPRWSAPRARDRARELLLDDNPWDVIVLLGRKVTETFRAVGEVAVEWPPFTHRSMVRKIVETPGNWACHMRSVISLPHPSGRNLVWNDLARRFEARRLLAEHAPELWPEAAAGTSEQVAGPERSPEE